MKTAQVTVKFPEGLHLRPASRLIRLIRRFRSQIHLRCGPKLANGRSMVSLLLLAAACNTELDVLASGDDEEDAIRAVQVFFQQGESVSGPVSVVQGEFANPDSPTPK